jgi:hypothetical protein
MKKKTRRMQLSRETLVHLQGRSGLKEELGASHSYCVPDCIGMTSANNFVCQEETFIYP